MRAAIVCACLIAAAAPAAARNLRIVWLASGAPAANIDVHFNARAAAARTDANGIVAIPADAKTVLAVDPISSLLLASSAVGSDEELRVPEPVRVRGSIAGGTGAITVRAGDGARVPALTRWQRDRGMLSDERPAYAALGVPLPESPLRWRPAVVRERTFVTGWMLAAPRPQIAAFDSTGAYAVTEVAIPRDVAPRAMIDAGAITLHAPSILDVHVALPPGDVATSLQLHLTSGSVADREAAARDLAVYDQIDARIFALLGLGDAYVLPPDGRARLRTPAWLASAHLVLRESFGGGRIERDVVLDARAPAALKAAFADLGSTVAARPVSGTVTRAQSTRPVADARVVLSDGALRRETTTDRAGRFRFENVTAAGALSFFVDARGRTPYSHRRTFAFRETPGPEVTLQLPAAPPPSMPPPAIVSGPFANCGVGDDQYPFFYIESGPAGVADWNVTVNWETNQVTVTASAAGTWVINAFPNPFIFESTSVTVTRPDVAVTASFGEPALDSTTLQFFFHSGAMMNPGTTIYFAPPVQIAEWFDPTEIDLDANSEVPIPCLNNTLFALYVNDNQGNGCDGDITITNPCTIFLPADQNAPCVCTQGSNLPPPRP